MKVIISGIGTGGHYFPALVVSREFMHRDIPITFIARKGHMEEKLAKSWGLPVFVVNPQGFYGKSLYEKIISVFSIIMSVISLHSLTRNIVGMTFGGYGSLPLILSCMVHRCPFYMFEANRFPGRATALFAGKAQRLFLGLPLAKGVIGKTMVTGVPIRKEFKNVRAPSAKKKELRKLLFLGGSQGARRLNQLALGLQDKLSTEYEITIICGKRDYIFVKKQARPSTKVIAFTSSLWEELERTDVIVSRAGALAGYEILSSGKPVLFIPFPFAIDDHQYYNAEYFTEIGNAMVLREEEVTEKKVIQCIRELLMASYRQNKVIMDAEQKIVQTIIKENS